MHSARSIASVLPLILFAPAFSLMGSGAHAQSVRAISQDAPTGPIDLRNQRSYNLIFFTFSPEDASVLIAKSSSFSVNLAVANNMMIPGSDRGETVMEDFETQRLAVTYNHGLGRGLQWGATLPVTDRDGGILDGLIESYHGLLQVGRTQDVAAGRNAYPEGRSVLKLIRADGTVEVDQGSAFGISDLSFELKKCLSGTQRLQSAVRLGVKVPTGDSATLLGSGAFDEGVDGDIDYKVSPRLEIFGDLGEVWMGRDGKIPHAARENMLTLWGFDVKLSRRDTLVLQTDGSDVVLKTGNTHTDTKPETGTLAFRRMFRDGIWSVAISENGDIFNYHAPYLAGIGPDVTLFTGITWTR